MDIIYNMAFSSMSTIHSMIHFNKKNVSDGFTGNVQLVGNMPQYNVSANQYGTTLVSSNATASPPTNVPAWFSICGTSNYVIAVSFGFENTGRNYVSSDAGNTWSGFLNAFTGSKNNHRQAWISRNGAHRLYTYNSSILSSSTDYGINYRTNSPATDSWIGAFVSRDGSVRLASSANGIFKITNGSGTSITTSNTTTSRNYGVIKGSDDGRYVLTITNNSGLMSLSTNYGNNWVDTSINARDTAVNFDGQYMIASTSGYNLWITSNYGTNWSNIKGTNSLQNGLPNTNIYNTTNISWGGCTISKTGKYMSVAGYFNQGTFATNAYVFISSDFG